MDSNQRIIVVGGGMFGVSTALALAEGGYKNIELVERNQVASGNTGYAAGILSLLTWNDDDAHIIHRTREKAKALMAWGKENGVASAHNVWKETPSITILGKNQQEALEDMQQRQKRMGGTSDALDHKAAGRAFPQVRFNAGEMGLQAYGDGCIAPGDLADLARHRAKSLGVKVREEHRVDRVVIQDQRATGIKFTNGKEERADSVVVAGGVWTRGLMDRSGVPIPLLGYRIQVASIESDETMTDIVHDAVLGFYTRPESKNRFLAGDGTRLKPYDPENFDRTADAQFQEEIAESLVKRFHKGDHLRYVNGWAGQAAGTPDRRPLVGALKAIQGLYLCTGDNGFGIMRGLGMGELGAAPLLGKKHPQGAAADPNRFGPKPPGDFPLAEGWSIKTA